MRKDRRGESLCAASLLLCSSLFAQTPYSVGVHYARGQDASPTFEGWEGNPDGSFSLYFGYYNRNTEEEIDVPIGPLNHFDGAEADRGQPTYFYAGRRWFVFKVVVPKTWTQNDKLVWTLTTKGRTNVSKGWLQPEWEIDKALITKNSPGDPFLRITNSTPVPGNIPPVVSGSPAQTVTLPAKVSLKVNATDDGIPKPGKPGRGGRAQGLQIRWITYRGPAKAVFDQEVSPAVYGEPLSFETMASFPMPGNYRLRAIATDGALSSTYDVDVQVNGQ